MGQMLGPTVPQNSPDFVGRVDNRGLKAVGIKTMSIFVAGYLGKNLM
jgi:hypothetical protein